MGDRANVFVKDQPESGVYLYTHWAGSELPQILQDALRRGQDRWTDSQYLARIIFCEMVKDEWEETTGYGISSVMGDNEHHILVVDPRAQTVSLASPGREKSGPYSAAWSMEEYVNLTPEQIETAFFARS